MSGILGIYNYSGGNNVKIDKELISSFCHALFHRGPDDIGIYIDEQSKIGLGHAQLSITDSSQEHQLIHNEDKTIYLIFDGAIYNYKELKDSLKEGHKLLTSIEYEILIHLYEEKGMDFINDLNGMFAFALWDLNKKQLIIGKDRFGIKPLYYTEVNGVFLFASEIKALLKYPNISQELDHSFVKCFIGLKCIPSPYTLHQGIHSLSQGHFLVCNKNGVSKQRKYWHLESLFVNEDTNFSENHYVSEIYKIISDSIKIRMLPEGTNGLFLSGGVDSGLLAGMMSQQSSQPIEAYSVGFEESNEFINSQRIARMFNCNYHEYMLTRKDFFDLLPEVISYSEDPVGDCAAIPLYLLSQKAKADAMKVLLFGCGVEEQFGGHYSQLAQVKIKNFSRYARFIPSPLKKLMYSLATMSNIPADRLYYVYKILFGPDHYDSQSGYFNDVLDNLMSAPYAIDRAEQIRNEYRELAKTHNMDMLTSWLFLDFSIKLPDDLMPGVERMSMAASIETRMPFLDHRLVEFTSRIPNKFKIKTDGEQKYIWKKVSEKILPKEIIYQEKLPFLVPFEQWLKEDKIKKLVYKIIFEDTKEEFFNLSFAEKLFNHTIENKRSYAELIWRMFFFRMWYKKWIENEEISF